jgi:hypothetical protein
MNATHVIEGTPTPRGSLTLAWPTDAGPHDGLTSAIADTLEAAMITDHGLQHVTVTVEISTPETTRGTTAATSSTPRADGQ